MMPRRDVRAALAGAVTAPCVPGDGALPAPLRPAEMPVALVDFYALRGLYEPRDLARLAREFDEETTRGDTQALTALLRLHCQRLSEVCGDAWFTSTLIPHTPGAQCPVCAKPVARGRVETVRDDGRMPAAVFWHRDPAGALHPVHAVCMPDDETVGYLQERDGTDPAAWLTDRLFARACAAALIAGQPVTRPQRDAVVDRALAWLVPRGTVAPFEIARLRERYASARAIPGLVGRIDLREAVADICEEVSFARGDACWTTRQDGGRAECAACGLMIGAGHTPRGIVRGADGVGRAVHRQCLPAPGTPGRGYVRVGDPPVDPARWLVDALTSLG